MKTFYKFLPFFLLLFISYSINNKIESKENPFLILHLADETEASEIFEDYRTLGLLKLKRSSRSQCEFMAEFDFQKNDLDKIVKTLRSDKRILSVSLAPTETKEPENFKNVQHSKSTPIKN